MGRKVTHIITGLGKGGAETMLYQVIKFRSNPLIEYKVISLGGDSYNEAPSYYEGLIRQLGIPVVICPLLKTPFSSMYHIIKNVKGSDVLCCWMMHANLVGFVVSRLAGIGHVIWCVRHSNTGNKFLKTRTVLIDSICAKLSRWVNQVTYNGNRSRQAYEKLGFCREKGIVVDNGCDCEEYAPNSEARGKILKELGIDKSKNIILSVTKNDPIKDIPTFIRAFSIFRKGHPETVAIMCGSGVEENAQMLGYCMEIGLEPHRDIYFLGMRHDIPLLLATCNLYVLHSAGEAFPNTLLQAMAASCLCIATDVGDARRIMGDDRFIVNPENPEELARKMAEVCALPFEVQKTEKARNRERVQIYFNIRDIVKNYEELYL